MAASDMLRRRLKSNNETNLTVAVAIMFEYLEYSRQTSAFHTSSPLMLTTTLPSLYYHPHFTDNKN